MGSYMVTWRDAGGEHKHNITADGLVDAKHIAFRMLCDASGDKLVDNVAVYEQRYEFNCKGEFNPKGVFGKCTQRDYATGAKTKAKKACKPPQKQSADTQQN